MKNKIASTQYLTFSKRYFRIEKKSGVQAMQRETPLVKPCQIKRNSISREKVY
jgi:hypothetical protein